MERLQGHCRKRRSDLWSPQPSIHDLELGREGVQACFVVGRGTQLQPWKLGSI